MKSKQPTAEHLPDEFPLPERRLRSGAWILAGVASGLVLSLIFVVHHFSTGLYFARLRLELASKLSGSERANDIFQAPRFRELLSPTDRSARRLFDLIETLEEGRLDDAKEKFASDQVLREDDRFRAIRTALEKISSRDGEMEKAAQKIADAETTLDHSVKQYRQLQNRLRALLKLPIESESDTAQGVPFYTSGMLSSLPVLPGIPDELTDDKSLVSYLGGDSVFPGGTLPADVKGEIPKLQADATPLALEIAKASRDVGQLEADRDALQARDEDLREAAIALARRELLSEIRPTIAPTTVAVYNNARPLFQRMGIELPELPFPR